MEVKMNPATTSDLSEIHKLTTDYIVNRIKDARETGALLSPAELSAITKFLKDNGIECTKDDMEKATGALHVLPGPNFEDIEEREAFM